MSSEVFRRAGFSLLEVVIYMALVALIMGGLLVSLYGIIGGSIKLQDKAIVNQEGLFLMRKIDWALSGANAVSVPNATTLNITKTGLPPGENPLVFTVLGDALLLSRGLGSSEPLNSTSVPVRDLAFTYNAGTKTFRVVFTTAYGTEQQVFDMSRYIRP